MKEPWQWEEEDIETLVNDRVQESLTLDYKACGALNRANPHRKDHISKDVSAFANSAGGTIIYGVHEDNHLPTGIDVGYDPADVTREWLEQVINSTIQRRVDGIRIKQVELKKNNPGRIVYVVDIPQSKNAPHMASDHRFYKRFNFESVFMEEYELRDVARRNEAPSLHLELFLKPKARAELVLDDSGTAYKHILLNISIENEGNSLVEYYIVKLYVDDRINWSPGSTDLKRFSSETLYFKLGDQEPLRVSKYSMNASPPGKMPLWKGIRFTLGECHIVLPQIDTREAYCIIWQADAPGMSTRQGIYLLKIEEDCAFLELQGEDEPI